MLKLFIFLILAILFALLVINELRHTPLAEEQEDGSYRFIEEDTEQ
ncbi:MAG: hypothetical protein HPY80_06555 [Bacteroidales bacterium]|jgi:hypothetical protein|nr:hypothetical protein [Bacteroidales bacterium]NPV36312.1 hypothetical protein [Bacteroidales bacterium]